MDAEIIMNELNVEGTTFLDPIRPNVIVPRGNGHHYNGSEKVIGTWFGETLYEKTFYKYNTESSFPDYITFAEASGIVPINMNFRVKRGSSDMYMTGNGSFWEQASNYGILFRYLNGYIQYRLLGYGTEINDMYLTIQYTKTT